MNLLLFDWDKKFARVLYFLGIGYIIEHNAAIDCACQDMRPRPNGLERINVFFLSNVYYRQNIAARE